MIDRPRFDVVIPTSGRASLDGLLAGLGSADGPLPERVLLVDDRPSRGQPLVPRVPGALMGRTFVVRSRGRGRAGACNLGWRVATAPWVVLLDEDVIPPPGWRAELAADVVGLAPTVAGTHGLIRVKRARWATADLALRRAALEAVGGFDQRLSRAYREDADLRLRLEARGLQIVEGRRRVLRPVLSSDRSTLLRRHGGKAGHALMLALRRTAGTLRARGAAATNGDAGGPPVPAPPLAVLLDRDGTLIHDVPYNGDPGLVLPMTGVRRSLDRLRAQGVKLAIVSNQSGIGRGLLTSDSVAAVTLRVVELLGPFDDVRWCPHVAADGCDCRKPAPGLLLGAAEALGVDPLRCAVVGDIGTDLGAARAAGMRGVLVPTASTRPEEIAAAPERAATLREAVDLLLRAPVAEPPPRPEPVGLAARGRPPLERVA